MAMPPAASTNPPSSPEGIRLHRRALLRLAGGTLAFALGRSSAAVAQDATPAPPPDDPRFQPFYGQTWVGVTADPDVFVALVAEATDSGTGPRPAVAFLCAGREFALWFAGTFDGDRFDLRFLPDPTDEGIPLEPPTLTATRFGDTVVGEADLRDALRPGPTRAFAAHATAPAGIAGLWLVERDAGGLVTGTASTGATLTAQLQLAPGPAPATPVGTASVPGSSASSSPAPTLGTPSISAPSPSTPTAGTPAAGALAPSPTPFRATGTITTVAGETVDVAIPARTDAPGIFRWIMLPTGRFRAAGVQRPASGTPTPAGAGIDF